MSDILTLSYRERSALDQFLKSRASGEQIKRAQALLLLDEEEPVASVAEALQVSRQTIYNWVNRFVAESAADLTSRLSDAPRSGRLATAQGIIDPLIDAVIDSDPRDYEYNSKVWTADLLRLYLSQVHGIEVGLRSVGYALVG